jgi:hypothetical protein
MIIRFKLFLIILLDYSMYLILIVCILILPFIIVLLRLSSTSRTTQTNVDFIQDIYDNCNSEYRLKIQGLIDWHKAYHHPFLAERSKKIDKCNNSENDMRFAIFTDLTAFVDNSRIPQGKLWAKKWFELSKILNIPPEIEKICIQHIEKGEEVDLIWGLDPFKQKEKIYLEYPHRGLIESYIVSNGIVLDRYKYIKTSTPNNSKYSFMYSRINSSGIKDSFHYALKEPIDMNNNKIYIVSHNPGDNTITYYYRPL